MVAHGWQKQEGVRASTTENPVPPPASDDWDALSAKEQMAIREYCYAQMPARTFSACRAEEVRKRKGQEQQP